MGFKYKVGDKVVIKKSNYKGAKGKITNIDKETSYDRIPYEVKIGGQHLWFGSGDMELVNKIEKPKEKTLHEILEELDRLIEQKELQQHEQLTI